MEAATARRLGGQYRHTTFSKIDRGGGGADQRGTAPTKLAMPNGERKADSKERRKKNVRVNFGNTSRKEKGGGRPRNGTRGGWSVILKTQGSPGNVGVCKKTWVPRNEARRRIRKRKKKEIPNIKGGREARPARTKAHRPGRLSATGGQPEGKKGGDFWRKERG